MVRISTEFQIITDNQLRAYNDDERLILMQCSCKCKKCFSKLKSTLNGRL